MRMKSKLLQNRMGFSLLEVMISALIVGGAFLAIYSAILWGRYRATQTQYIVSAADIGRHQIEVIKALGFTNATNSDYNKLSISSTKFNPNLGYGGTFVRTNNFSLDTGYDVESSYADDSSTGASHVLRVFTVNVYLHNPVDATDTTSPPFNTPLVTYVTYLTPGGI